MPNSGTMLSRILFSFLDNLQENLKPVKSESEVRTTYYYKYYYTYVPTYYYLQWNDNNNFNSSAYKNNIHFIILWRIFGYSIANENAHGKHDLYKFVLRWWRGSNGFFQARFYLSRLRSILQNILLLSFGENRILIRIITLNY